MPHSSPWFLFLGEREGGLNSEEAEVAASWDPGNWHQGPCYYGQCFVYECCLHYMYVYRVCAWSLRRSEEDVKSAVSGVMDGCEPSSGVWESNQEGLLEEAHVCLTTEHFPTPS